jgi:hypothetical protein
VLEAHAWRVPEALAALKKQPGKSRRARK